MIAIEAVSIAAPIYKLAQSAQETIKIHSVFEHAVNFLYAGQLIALIDATSGNLPYGICCRFEDLHFKKIFQPGAKFYFSEDGLHFMKEDLCVRWGSATIWQPARPELPAQCLVETNVERLIIWLRSLRTEPALMPHICWLANGLDQFPGETTPNRDDWVVRFSKLVKQLAQATVEVDWRDAEEAVYSLMGLGIGLTPSGDDFLAGFLTAGLVLGPREPFESLTRVVALVAPERTTLVSAALLQALYRDQLSERFGSLLEALGSSQGNLEEKAARMAEFGSSSGLETMYGFLYGARAVEKMSEINSGRRTHGN